MMEVRNSSRPKKEALVEISRTFASGTRSSGLQTCNWASEPCAADECYCSHFTLENDSNHYKHWLQIYAEWPQSNHKTTTNRQSDYKDNNFKNKPSDGQNYKDSYYKKNK